MGFTATNIETGNIGIGNTSTLVTFNKDLGKKCFAFTKLDAGAIRGIKKSAFGIAVRSNVRRTAVT